MDPQEMFDVARELVDDYGALDAAARILRWASEVEPADGTILTYRASLLSKLGHHEEALRCINKLPEPDDAETLNLRGLARGGCLDYAGAIADFTASALRNPRQMRPWANRAAMAFYSGDYQRCADDLVRTLLVQGYSGLREMRFSGQRPGWADFASILTGFAHIRAEAAAENAFAFTLIDAWREIVLDRPKRAIRLIAGIPPAERGRGQTLAMRALVLDRQKSTAADRRSERRQRATKAERQRLKAEALALNPDDVALLVSIDGDSAYDQRPPLELERALAQTPRWFAGFLEASRERHFLRDRELALAHAEKAVELEPESWDALEALADALVVTGDYARALRALDTVVELYDLDDRSDAAASEESAADGAAFDLGLTPSESDSDDDDAVEEEPPEPRPENGLEERLRQYDEADFRRTREALLGKRAYVRYKLRDLAGAQAAFDHMIATARPDEWSGFRDRARFLAFQRRWTEALADVDECVRRIQIGDDEGFMPRWLLRLRAFVRERAGDHAGAAADRSQLRRSAPRQRKKTSRARAKKASAAGRSRPRGGKRSKRRPEK